eukprot:6212938-Pleurochrysis_carterae.AAC.1
MLVAAAAAIEAAVSAKQGSASHVNGGDRNTRRVRIVCRAAGKWKGSTLNGYLAHGDEQTYRENFCMSKETLVGLVKLIASTGKMGEDPETYLFHPVIGAMYRAHNHPTPRFKVATCVFFMAHSGPLKATVDAASIGKSTLRRWLGQFFEGTVSGVKPKYMPKTSPEPANLAAVQKQFAARCGIWNVAMACDGTHIPFRPTTEKTAEDYRNYKGWHSWLVVAFINSFYMFVDADCGYPGRSGDNMVLKQSRFLQKVASDPKVWLIGERGVILADGGASDGDKLFLNPILQPLTPQECWYYFCHTSTSPHPPQLLLSIFHNNNALAEVPGVNEDPDWMAYFKRYERLCCPTCVRRNITHCLHQAQFCIGKRLQTSVSGTPSARHNSLKKILWTVLEMEGATMTEDETVLQHNLSAPSVSKQAAELVREMTRRATTEIICERV